MAKECFPPGGQDERLYEVLLDYLESTERGHTPDPDELLARHPEFAPELKEYLETRDRVEGLAAPLRWVTRAVLDASRNQDDAPALAADRTASGGALPLTRTRVFGDYDVREEIGRGGMCVVHKARDRTLNRLVALKMVRGSRLGDEDALRRFRNEAETVAALDHPNIVPLYEVGEEEGQLFFSMKLLEGGSLKDRLRDFVADPGAAARLTATIARAVGYAHRRGVLHRDLKPSNVLLDAEDRPHVADFGLAKWLGNDTDLTQTGALLGTPSYMAPEQASPRPRPRPGVAPGRGPNHAVTTAADVYGLGAVLYALLTGRPPFLGPGLLLTLEQVRHDPPRAPRSLNPRVDRDLENVCLKCLEKDPARRYGSADQLADDLERWLRNEPVLARRATPGRRLRLWSRRHRAWSALAVAVAVFVPALIVTLAAAVVGVGRERDRALEQEGRAQAREKEVRRQLYAADMALAHRTWLHGDVNGMGRLLDNWRPEPGADDLRDCAWRLLDPLRRADPLAAPAVETAHRGDVYAVAFSPDGRVLASAGKDASVRLRVAGKEPLVLQGHRGEVNGIDFDGTGRQIATASDDGTARVWDVATGRQLLELKGHDGEVVAVKFALDHKTLLTAGRDGTLRQWRLPSGEPLRVVRVGDERIAGMALSPDGRSVATAGKDKFVRVWDLATGAMRFERRLPGQCQCVAYGPRGHTLAAGDIAGHIWLFASGDGDALVMLTCDNGCAVESVAFAPAGMTLASCGLHGRVRLWDLSKSSLLRNLDFEDRRVWCVTFSPDGRSLVCGADDGVIRTWEMAAAQAARFVPGPSGDGGLSLAFSPDGRTLAVAGPDGTVSLRDPSSLRSRAELKTLRLSEKGRRLVRFELTDNVLGVCGPNGSLERWDLAGPYLLDLRPGKGKPPRTLCFRPGTTDWLACLNASPPQFWDSMDGTNIPAGFERTAWTAAAWSPDGTILAASSTKGVQLFHANGRGDGATGCPERAAEARPWHSRPTARPSRQSIGAGSSASGTRPTAGRVRSWRGVSWASRAWPSAPTARCSSAADRTAPSRFGPFRRAASCSHCPPAWAAVFPTSPSRPTAGCWRRPARTPTARTKWHCGRRPRAETNKSTPPARPVRARSNSTAG